MLISRPFIGYVLTHEFLVTTLSTYQSGVELDWTSAQEKPIVKHLKKFQCMNTRHRGFTLIEIMVTVAILAILASIAVPSYTEYILRGRIPEATGALAESRVKMEQWFQDHRSYHRAPNDNTCGPQLPVGLKNFDIACVAPDRNTYTLTATGKVGGSMANFAFTIDQAGNRKTPHTKWSSTSVDCWVSKKGDTC